MSVMGFQKKFVWEVGGWGELYPIFLLLLSLQSRLVSTVFDLISVLFAYGILGQKNRPN